MQPNKLPPTAIAAANSSLLNRGVRLSLEQRGQTLGIRGTWTNLDGQRRQQRLKIDCPATPGGLLEAEKIAIQTYGCIQQGLDPKAGLEAERKRQRRRRMKLKGQKGRERERERERKRERERESHIEVTASRDTTVARSPPCGSTRHRKHEQ